MIKISCRNCRRKGKRGVITVFVSLLLVVVLSFTGAMTEAVRIMGARMQAQVASDCSVDSIMSQYDSQLMNNYQLFFKNGMEGDSIFLQENLVADMKKFLGVNLSPESAHSLLTHSDFWKLEVKECVVQEYELATDNNCRAYRRQAADSVKGQIGQEFLEQLKEWEKNPVNVDELEQDLGKREQENENQMNEVVVSENVAGEESDTSEENDATLEAQKQNIQNAVESVENDKKVNDKDNPIAIVKEIKEKGILNLVMPKDIKISEKRILGEDLVSKRSLNQGTSSFSLESTMEKLEEKVLFHEYLFHNFSCVVDEKVRELDKESPLSYELEYMIAGKETDIDNLKSVVHRLLLMREVVNYGYLLTDEIKQIQAETLAVAITGTVGMVALTKVVKHGILLAWAYGESILDVRQLMSGGKVSLVKTDSQWKLELENFGLLLDNSNEKKEEEKGLSYKDYLRILLFAENEQNLTLRSLDMIELTMQNQDGKSDYMMDQLVGGVVIETKYQIPSLFYSGGNSGRLSSLNEYETVSRVGYMQ